MLNILNILKYIEYMSGSVRDDSGPWTLEGGGAGNPEGGGRKPGSKIVFRT